MEWSYKMVRKWYRYHIRITEWMQPNQHHVTCNWWLSSSIYDDITGAAWKLIFCLLSRGSLFDDKRMKRLRVSGKYCIGRYITLFNDVGEWTMKKRDVIILLYEVIIDSTDAWWLQGSTYDRSCRYSYHGDIVTFWNELFLTIRVNLRNKLMTEGLTYDLFE